MLAAEICLCGGGSQACDVSRILLPKERNFAICSAVSLISLFVRKLKFALIVRKQGSDDLRFSHLGRIARISLYFDLHQSVRSAGFFSCLMLEQQLMDSLLLLLAECRSEYLVDAADPSMILFRRIQFCST